MRNMLQLVQALNCLPILLVVIICSQTSEGLADDQTKTRKLNLQEAIDAGIRLVGRWQLGASKATCQWPSTGMEFRFNGKLLEITLEDSAPGTKHEVTGFQSNYVDIAVEGKPRVALRLEPGVKTYRVIDESESRNRLVMVWKRTESSVGKVSFHGVAMDAQASIIRTPLPKGLMDFYGNSDACGYGVEVSDRNQHFAPATENAEKAFAVVAIKKLGFDVRLIAASGWGISRGYGGEKELSIPLVANRVFIEDADLKCDNVPPADVIVVMLGDNDFHLGDPGTDFDQAYERFAMTLHKRTPNAKMLLCIGTSLKDEPNKPERTRVTQAIESIVSKLNSGRPALIAYKLEISPYREEEGYGADWHTSEKAHERIGNEIAEAVSKALAQP
jgi:hypothetical protein